MHGTRDASYPAALSVQTLPTGFANANTFSVSILVRSVRTFARAALTADDLGTTRHLRGIAPGLYTLRVQAGAASAARKLVVE